MDPASSSTRRTPDGRWSPTPDPRLFGALHLHRVLYEQARRHAGRAACPSVVIMDGQSVKTTERGGARGFDAHKRVKGRKRHILVDRNHPIGRKVSNVPPDFAPDHYVIDHSGTPQRSPQQNPQSPFLICRSAVLATCVSLRSHRE